MKGINKTNKILLVLVGVPWSGKTTWIEENNLENYVLSTDKFRLIYGTTELMIEQEEEISQKFNKIIFEKFYDALKIRMEAGLFTVLDATHLNVSYFDKYKELAEKFWYSIVAKRFHISLETTLERNEKRGFKKVRKEVVENFYENSLAFELPKYVEEIDSISDLSNNILEFQDVTNKYQKIYYIGDIQWCFVELKKFIDVYYNEKNLYVFTGDLLDRWPDNLWVLEQILEIVDKPNVILIKGNHDVHLEKYVKNWGKPVGIREFDNNTIPQISSLKLSQIKKITNKFIHSCSLQIGLKKIFACHWWVTKLKTFITDKQLISGVGSYDEHEMCDTLFYEWSKKQNEDFYSVHWHRNLANNPIKVNKKVFNLEGKIEFGWELRVVIFEANKAVQTLEIQSSTPKNQRENYFEQFSNDKLINVNDLWNGIFSINFKRTAFQERIWSSVNIKARGLFMGKTSNIYARSYNKFFNVGEREETKEENLAKNIGFPVIAYKKYNGFLGIVGLKWNRVLYCSKSRIEGDFPEMVKKHLKPFEEKLLPILKK